MKTELVTLPSIADMQSVKKALESHHQAFPVLNTAGHLVGLIPKVILVKLVAEKQFYETRRLSIANRPKPQAQAESINDGTDRESMLEANRDDEMNKRYDITYDETEGGFPPTPVEKRMAFANFRCNLN